VPGQVSAPARPALKGSRPPNPEAPADPEGSGAPRRTVRFGSAVDVARYPNLRGWQAGDDERDERARAAGEPPHGPVLETHEGHGEAGKERARDAAWTTLRDRNEAAKHRPPFLSDDAKRDIPPTE
jgi:hypothetical protein